MKFDLRIFVLLFIFLGIVGTYKYFNIQHKKEDLISAERQFYTYQLLEKDQLILLSELSSRNNYDALTLTTTELDSMGKDLIEHFRRIGLSEVKNELNSLQNNMSLRSSLIDDYKSYHSVVKNSLLFLNKLYTQRLNQDQKVDFITPALMEDIKELLIGYYSNSMSNLNFSNIATKNEVGLFLTKLRSLKHLFTPEAYQLIEDKELLKIMLSANMQMAHTYYKKLAELSIKMKACNNAKIENEIQVQIEKKIELYTTDEKWLIGFSFASALLFLITALVSYYKEYKSKKDAIFAHNAKDEFLSNMSHELRTPLNAIGGFAQIMAHKIGDDKILQKYVLNIKNSSDHLLHLINDILDIAKIQSGKFKIEPHEYELKEETLTVISRFDALSQQAKIKVTLNRDKLQDITLYGDWMRITQVINNLVSNAIKFTQKDGEVKVDIYYENSTLFIIIKDNGIGMSKETQEKIFDAFTQADSTTTKKHGGTGLGLSITKDLLLLMDAKLELSSELDRGSTFKITIPQKLINTGENE
ncbi:MAG: hypothetical protein GQ570_14585 [Helicobacteraceae bacterium]|nr:hypothetical protein [Helicobacteraceae bacterium]